MHMIRLSLTTLLLFVTGVAWSQKAFIFNTQQKNGFVSLAIGTSHPMGTLVQKPGDLGINLALRGQALSLATGYRLAGPLGLMARYEHITNTIDPSGNAPGQTATGLTNNVLTATGQTERLQSRSIMAGPYLTVPVGRFAFDLRALAGQIWINSPLNSPSAAMNRPENAARAGNEQATALVAGVGLTTRFRLTPCVALHVSGDYSSATFSYGNVPVASPLGSYAPQTTQFSQKTLRSATFSVGLTFQFKSRNTVF